MKNTTITYLLLSALTIFILSQISSAEEQEPVCTFDLGSEIKYSVYWTYSTYEVSGRLLHVTQDILYTRNTSRKHCIIWTRKGGDDWRIFDFKIYKDYKEIGEIPYLDFYVNDDNKTETRPVCFLMEFNSKITIDYYMGNKIQSSTSEEWLKSISYEPFYLLGWSEGERYYPFDIYNFSIWFPLDDRFYTTDYTKIVLPPTLEVIESNTISSCPECIGNRIFRGETWLMDMLVFSNMEVFEGEFLRSDERNVVVFPSKTCCPMTNKTKAGILLLYNSTEDFYEVKDWRNGHYLLATFQRPEIIKSLFWISIALQIAVCIFFLFIIQKSLIDNVFGLSKYCLGIWVFQEGLSTLTPLVRPMIVTVFDLTIFIPVFFIVCCVIYSIEIKSGEMVCKVIRKILRKIRPYPSKKIICSICGKPIEKGSGTNKPKWMHKKCKPKYQS